MLPADPLSDEHDDILVLVEAARRGDSEAFARLYRAFAPAVHAVVLTKVPSEHAPDLVHDAFEKAFKELCNLKEPTAFPSWLNTIARNRAIDFVRRERPAEPLREDHLVAPSSSPTIGAELLSLVRSLPETYCETLLMRFAEDMTGPEIAARTGMTPGSVRVNLSRGMKLLRAKLALRGRHV